MNQGTVSFRTGTIWLGVFLIIISAAIATIGFMSGKTKIGVYGSIAAVVCIVGLIGWTQIYK